MKIYTIANTRPDFIELQMRSFRKYLQEPFEFTVIDNSQFSIGCRGEGIRDACSRAGAVVIPVQKDQRVVDRCQAVEVEGGAPIFNTSNQYTSVNAAAAYALCWAWENIIVKANDAVCILDSDVFLTAPVNLSSYLEKYQFAWVAQARPGIEFIWPVLFFADLRKLPNPETINWYGGAVNGVRLDVSGQTYHYLQAHPELSNLRIQQQYTREDPLMGVEHADYEILSLESNPVAMHYRSGSNWNRKSEEYHRIKTEWLKRMIG
jgi:hypothetical protein